MRAAWLSLAGPLGLLAMLWACAAGAHIVAGGRTLSAQVREADLVATARILAVDRRAGEAGAQRPAVEAEILEVLKGRAPEAPGPAAMPGPAGVTGPRVRFAQHGHGVVPFEPGDTTLLFLLDVARSRELQALAASEAVSHVSLQEHAEEIPLAAPERDVAVEAVRRYVRAEAEPAPGARMAALREVTRLLLTSGQTRLAASALRDLVAAPKLPLVRSEDVPALLAVIEDPQASMGLRAGLLAELERRQLVEGPVRWAQLVDAAPPGDRITAIRAAGAHPSPPVRERLIARLADPDEEVAAAAALALGAPEQHEAVPALAGALSSEAPRVRMAAIRSLGRIGSAGLPILREAAAQHPDPATRRRAAAELRVREAAGARR